jgi:hypothetical protein
MCEQVSIRMITNIFPVFTGSFFCPARLTIALVCWQNLTSPQDNLSEDESVAAMLND